MRGLQFGAGRFDRSDARCPGTLADPEPLLCEIYRFWRQVDRLL